MINISPIFSDVSQEKLGIWKGIENMRSKKWTSDVNKRSEDRTLTLKCEISANIELADNKRNYSSWTSDWITFEHNREVYRDVCRDWIVVC